MWKVSVQIIQLKIFLEFFLKRTYQAVAINVKVEFDQTVEFGFWTLGSSFFQNPRGGHGGSSNQGVNKQIQGLEGGKTLSQGVHQIGEIVVKLDYWHRVGVKLKRVFVDNANGRVSSISVGSVKTTDGTNGPKSFSTKIEKVNNFCQKGHALTFR